MNFGMLMCSAAAMGACEDGDRPGRAPLRTPVGVVGDKYLARRRKFCVPAGGIPELDRRAGARAAREEVEAALYGDHGFSEDALVEVIDLRRAARKRRGHRGRKHGSN